MERSSSTKRRWPLILVSLVTFLVICFLVVGLSSGKRDFEPDWLAKIPKSETKREELFSTTPGTRTSTFRKFIDTSSRFVNMPYPEVVQKLNGELRTSDGWKVMKALNTEATNWILSDGSGSYSIWASPSGTASFVGTSSVLKETLAERIQAWLRRAFGGSSVNN